MIETEDRLVAARPEGRKRWGVAANGVGFPFEVMKMFWNWTVVMAAPSEALSWDELSCQVRGKDSSGL